MKRASKALAAASLLASWLGAAGAQGLLPGERETNIVAIPGVVATGARWEIVWADFETADGIVGTPDGGVIFAQEQTDTIRKLAADGKEYTVLAQTRGVGSVSLDAQGRLYVATSVQPDVGRFLPDGTWQTTNWAGVLGPAVAARPGTDEVYVLGTRSPVTGTATAGVMVLGTDGTLRRVLPGGCGARPVA